MLIYSSTMYKNKLGIGIISFKRHKYIAQTIQSLEKQTHLENTDFHLFQDGSKNKFSGISYASEEEINASVNHFRNSRLPNKIEHIRNENYGNGIQQFEAVEYMAANYLYFLIIEDDVILSPHYLRLIRIIIDQFMDYEDVFSISLSFKRHCPKEDIRKHLDKIGYINGHWWAECWSSKKWHKYRSYFLEYFKLIDNCDYVQRPHQEIINFFETKEYGTRATSQDAGKDYMLFKAGMRRLSSVVNRGFYIGVEGLHFRKEIYNELGFGAMKPYIFNEDKELKKFTLI